MGKSYDFTFGIFIGRFPGDGAENMAVKGLRTLHTPGVLRCGLVFIRNVMDFLKTKIAWRIVMDSSTLGTLQRLDSSTLWTLPRLDSSTLWTLHRYGLFNVMDSSSLWTLQRLDSSTCSNFYGFLKNKNSIVMNSSVLWTLESVVTFKDL